MHDRHTLIQNRDPDYYVALSRCLNSFIAYLNIEEVDCCRTLIF